MNFHATTDVRANPDIREEPQNYIQSQYSHSVTICRLLEKFRDEISPTADIRLFIDNVMSLDTAVGNGLDVLGRIIGIERTLSYKDQSFTLNDDLYRSLLKYKALANITDTSLATLNKMTSILFPNDDIKVYAIIHEGEEDGKHYNKYPMHVRWYTNKDLTTEEKATFQAGGLLTLNAGVGWEFLAIDESSIFGFLGSSLQPFDCGRFFNSSEVMTE